MTRRVLLQARHVRDARGKSAEKRGEELRSCGVKDGSAVQVASRVRGGGKHKDKKSKTEKKQAAGPKKSEFFTRTAGAEGYSRDSGS